MEPPKDGKAIWAVVGNRIGPDCLACALGESPRDRFVVSLADNADPGVVATLLQSHDGPAVEVVSFGDVEAAVLAEEVEIDWLLNLWGNKIFKSEVLAKVGDSLNIHPSLLPSGRGSDPVVWAVLEGAPIGASLHRMTPLLDGGPIWAVREVEYSHPILGGEAYEAVLAAALELFRAEWPMIRRGKVAAKEQQGSSTAPRRRAELLSFARLTQAQLESLSADQLLARAMALDFGEAFGLDVEIADKRWRVKVMPGSQSATTTTSGEDTQPG